MASNEPTDEMVTSVMDMLSMDNRKVVFNALKSNSCDVEQVIDQYFSNPDTFMGKYTSAWDENLFAADRDGSANNTGISFHIESSDPSTERAAIGATPPPLGHAPSRPPSRTNNRSPLGAPNSRAQEDDDIERALRESAQEAGIMMPAQESGVMKTTSPHFGPANRNDYDQADWAMVPTASMGDSRTFDSGPDPTFRKRTPGAPAMLISRPSAHGEQQLGGLLTILHEIPLARNSLLKFGAQTASYTYGKDWWKGQETFTMDSDQDEEMEAAEIGRRFDEEVHCLMAFLDSTERAYGSASVLIDMIPFSEDVVAAKQFYEKFKERSDEHAKPLYSTAVVDYCTEEHLTALVEADREDEETARFGLIEIEHGRDLRAETLYDMIDGLMWTESLGGEMIGPTARMAMFREMGEVLSIKLNNIDKITIRIPEVFYPERYLESRKEEAKRIQLGLIKVMGDIQNLEKIERQLRPVESDSNQRGQDKKTKIESSIEQWTSYRDYLETSARWRCAREADQGSTHPDYHDAPAQMTDAEQSKMREVEEVLAHLKRQVEEVEATSTALENHRLRLLDQKRFLSRLLMDPEKVRSTPMSDAKFLLRGIVTSKDTVYVCQRAEPDLIEFEDPPKQKDQWWRLSYLPSRWTEPAQAIKLEFVEVVRRVWDDTKTPLLVFATEKALTAEKIALPDQLQAFVTADNKVFAQELSQQTPEAEHRTLERSEAMSPSKRKHRDSMDSLDSNRASVGSDEMDEALGRAFSDQTSSGPSDSVQLSTQSQSEFQSTLDALGPRTSTQELSSAPATELQHIETKATSPEMLERGRPPAFPSLSQGDSEQAQPVAEISSADPGPGGH